MASVVVAGGDFDRQIDVAESGIERHRRPDTGVA
jgi:hypothetical protein